MSKSNPNNINLVILEQPSERFRFRYKSEMRGTHGSLYGERSGSEKRTKTFPEVELRNFKSCGIIRCSLYQAGNANLHPHQLVVHKDDQDTYDPHDVKVSPKQGYIARFENMGIIHTAKKDIFQELLKKKTQKALFEQQNNELSQKQLEFLRIQAKNEAKGMNLNEVRLCFEAFKTINGQISEKICEPVFSRPIKNCKSPVTSELKICRLSIVTGSVEGNDDLIILVEKVCKNNIRVRFYEKVEDNVLWEADAIFNETNVHHQYAIIVSTPPYKNLYIKEPVEVFVELIRKSDNECSSSVRFRYKPKEESLLGKRKRFTTISEEPIRNRLQNPVVNENDLDNFLNRVNTDLTILQPYFMTIDENLFSNVTDGCVKMNKPNNFIRCNYDTKVHEMIRKFSLDFISAFNDRFTIGFGKVIEKILKIFNEYIADRDNNNTIVHDIVRYGCRMHALQIFKILLELHLKYLLSLTNKSGETPLHVACLYGQYDFIGRLLILKCDPNKQDIYGNTALHIVVAENSSQCLEKLALYSSSINANLTNNDGLTPLHLAIRKNNIKFVKDLLVKFNSSGKISNAINGNNALHLAIQQKNKDIVECILTNCECNIIATNRDDLTALDMANNLIGVIKEDILELLHSYLPPSVDFEPKSDYVSDSLKQEGELYLQSSIDIKEETIFTSSVSEVLSDKQNLKHLAELLNERESWKEIARLLNLGYLICLFKNAEAMLCYIIETNNIHIESLLEALQKVNKKAAQLVIDLLKN